MYNKNNLENNIKEKQYSFNNILQRKNILLTSIELNDIFVL